eukprot:1772424-Karenia_brevis.AAC.1
MRYWVRQEEKKRKQEEKEEERQPKRVRHEVGSGEPQPAQEEDDEMFRKLFALQGVWEHVREVTNINQIMVDIDEWASE